MRVEEIALRQEARQMLAEAGLGKEELKALVLKDIDEKVARAIDAKEKEVNLDAMIERKFESAVNKAVDEVVQRQVDSFFRKNPLKITATVAFEKRAADDNTLYKQLPTIKDFETALRESGNFKLIELLHKKPEES